MDHYLFALAFINVFWLVCLVEFILYLSLVLLFIVRITFRVVIIEFLLFLFNFHIQVFIGSCKPLCNTNIHPIEVTLLNFFLLSGFRNSILILLLHSILFLLSMAFPLNIVLHLLPFKVFLHFSFYNGSNSLLLLLQRSFWLQLFDFGVTIDAIFLIIIFKWSLQLFTGTRSRVFSTPVDIAHSLLHIKVLLVHFFKVSLFPSRLLIFLRLSSLFST